MIVCVGETLEDRESDRTESVLAAQIDALARFTPGVRVDRFAVAYEPVWAIGTGLTASARASASSVLSSASALPFYACHLLIPVE